MDNLAIYSIFCGTSGNRTVNLQPVDRRYRHFFISNNREVLEETAAAGWTPVFIDFDISEDPVVSGMQSKIPKANPRLVGELSSFDWLCYKDDKKLLDMDVLEDCVAFVENANAAIGISLNPLFSDNILFEFGESMGQLRYKSQWKRIVNYINEEIEKGYKLQSRLYWTGAILRNMRHPDTETIDQTWFEHIWRCGTQCQISFDFVAQRFSSIAVPPTRLLL